VSAQLYIAFILATTVLILIPGPNVSLIVANSLSYGPRYALTTVAGTSSAAMVQLGLTILGMTSAMMVMAAWFDWLRWIGVAYLLWLGVGYWRAKAEALPSRATARIATSRLFWQGFLVSLTNPKTLLFYAAFLPQFVDANAPLVPQLLLLSITFLVIAVTLDSTWCLLAGQARSLLRTERLMRLRNRVTGSLLIASGVGLALARRQ
jgi:homoserine/homoserine lactone efflux protein